MRYKNDTNLLLRLLDYSNDNLIIIFQIKRLLLKLVWRKSPRDRRSTHRLPLRSATDVCACVLFNK